MTRKQLYKSVELKMDYFSFFHTNNPMKDKSWIHKPNNKQKIFNASDDYVSRRLDRPVN